MLPDLIFGKNLPLWRRYTKKNKAKEKREEDDEAVVSLCARIRGAEPSSDFKLMEQEEHHLVGIKQGVEL